MSMMRCEKHGAWDSDKHEVCPPCQSVNAPTCTSVTEAVPTAEQLRNAARFGTPLRAETLIALADHLEAAAKGSIPHGSGQLVERVHAVVKTGDETADMIIAELAAQVNRNADRIEAAEQAVIKERGKAGQWFDEAERLRWLHHNTYVSPTGWEYGVARVKHDKNGKLVSAEWTLADHSDIDAIRSMTAPEKV